MRWEGCRVNRNINALCDTDDDKPVNYTYKILSESRMTVMIEYDRKATLMLSFK